jgi:toxin ParE1/3/4
MADEAGGVEYHAEAAEEVEAAAAWYNVRHAGLGLRFFDAVEAIEDLIVEHPISGSAFLGRRVPGGVRRHQVPGFPFAVIYVTDPRLIIVAVAHGRRRPGYWRNRLAASVR